MKKYKDVEISAATPEDEYNLLVIRVMEKYELTEADAQAAIVAHDNDKLKIKASKIDKKGVDDGTIDPEKIKLDELAQVVVNLQAYIHELARKLEIDPES